MEIAELPVPASFDIPVRVMKYIVDRRGSHGMSCVRLFGLFRFHVAWLGIQNGLPFGG